MTAELKALLEECARQRGSLLLQLDALNTKLNAANDRCAAKDKLLARARNLHELPWKERVSLQDFIDQELGT